jgi:hypothetical protein
MQTILRSGWVVGLGLLGVVLVGCASTPAQRIAKVPAFAEYPAEVQALIERGEVAPGFTPEQVTLALGRPARVRLREDAQGRAEIWSYEEKKPQLGLGFGVGGGSGGVGLGTGVSLGTGGGREETMRVVLREGRVTDIERAL